MEEIEHEAARLLRVARETNQVSDQWQVGGYALNELRSLFLEQSGVFVYHGHDEITFMGLRVVFDPVLPDRRIVLQAGRNTVGAFTA